MFSSCYDILTLFSIFFQIHCGTSTVERHEILKFGNRPWRNCMKKKKKKKNLGKKIAFRKMIIDVTLHGVSLNSKSHLSIFMVLFFKPVAGFIYFQ